MEPVRDTYMLNLSEYNVNAWEVHLTDTDGLDISEVTLDPGSSVEVRLKVKATKAGPRDVAEISVSARSSLQSNVTDDVQATTQVAGQILVVNGATLDENNYTNYFTNPLDKMKFNYDVVGPKDGPVTSGEMAKYPIVIWIEPEGELTRGEVENLTGYLESGLPTDKKSLFISGKMSPGAWTRPPGAVCSSGTSSRWSSATCPPTRPRSPAPMTPSARGSVWTSR
ncbi:MAG TPA: hypothetical protein EYP43_00910 [Thermoplasmata archaeon]|nr:hypothetical protein [Thermoplasmata archaeon]